MIFTAGWKKEEADGGVVFICMCHTDIVSKVRVRSARHEVSAKKAIEAVQREWKKNTRLIKF